MSHEVPESFYSDGLITDVLHVVKSGKEATVYCCAAGPAAGGTELAAVKVYRPITERSFKNDAVYWEGRNVLRAGRVDRRARKAVAQHSKKGRLSQMGTWAADEYDTLDALWHAGARVPRPYGRKMPNSLSPGTALCMEYVGDRGGAAPKLIEADLTPGTAARLLRDVLDDVALFLSLERVHGDLSPYNILYWRGQAVVIDFPQSVDATANSHAYTLLERDVTNVCEFFARCGGPRRDPVRVARAMWGRYWRRAP